MRRTFGVARLLLATVELVSLTGYFMYTLSVASFAIGNFFAYFTVLSAMTTVIVLVTAATIALRRPRDPAWLDMARVMITTYILVSGVVYAIIVWQAASVNYSIAVPWSSQILHFWIPAFVLIDWIVDPYKARVPWRYLAWVIVFPVIWLVGTLIRGDILGWYPYFFLDARQVSGPTETVLYCALIVVIITGIAAILVTATRIKWKPRTGTTSMSLTHPHAQPTSSPAPRPSAGQHKRHLKRSRTGT
ncbi:Pr6Pr family membrane protein [Cryobacterium psychrophilum]|uniref:Uncharacterized protein n=1 Tax=Cryobacterium psychrophilum TaxID=41988 RepID=A0A4Y8KQ88_9MICO|nr:Pr6Pr family membrane protein [Cryobacterium psychrophilum]TDW29355.1 hypothetical protein EDD25_1049 [Cryobacterium psychrophilum]TFD80024.1 hypothetical protein E3T53_06390 [Cryobacterium psychrophilum]